MTQDCQGDIGAGGQEDHKDRFIMEDRWVRRDKGPEGSEDLRGQRG